MILLESHWLQYGLRRSKQWTLDLLQSSQPLNSTWSPSIKLHLPRRRCLSRSPSTTSPSWRTAGWPRWWAWCRWPAASQGCGLTSAVKYNCILPHYFSSSSSLQCKGVQFIISLSLSLSLKLPGLLEKFSMFYLAHASGTVPWKVWRSSSACV